MPGKYDDFDQRHNVELAARLDDADDEHLEAMQQVVRAELEARRAGSP